MLDFSTQTVNSENGWASVQNQQVIIHDHMPGGQPAQLSVSDQAISSFNVLIGDLLLEGSMTVNTRTPISIQFPPAQAPVYESEFKLSPDRCSLELRIIVKQAGQEFVLTDQPPSPHLTLSLSSQSLPLKDFEQTLCQDILQAIQNSGILKGIQAEGIRQAIKQVGEWALVAKTPQPIHGENRLDFLFELPRPEADKALGFRIRWPFLETCLADEIILQRFFRPPGRPGYTVYGDLLKSEPAAEPALSATDNSVEISEFGEVFAKRAGLPIFDGERIRIAPLEQLSLEQNQAGLIHDSDHSISIEKNLSDQSRLWAKGFIEIQGNVNQSEIHSTESLIIHGSCIGSNLTAGGDSAARMRLLAPVTQLKQNMEALLSMYQDLESRVPFSQLPPSKDIFMRLLKTQFPNLIQETEHLRLLNKSLKQLHPRRTMLLKIVLSHFMNLSERPLNLKIFKDWLDKISAFRAELEPDATIGGDVYLGYAQKTNLVAKGSIFVLGEGSYNSDLQAGGDILFCGKPGYCREGTLQARGRIVAGELGSPNGSRLKIKLPIDGQIDADLIHPGVEICFGEAPVQHVIESHQRVQMHWKNEKLHLGDSQIFKSGPKTEILIKKV